MDFKSIDIKYGQLQIFVNWPNLGIIQDEVIEAKLFTDYLTAPPFGLNINRDQITGDNIKNGWCNTFYLQVYISLCNYGDKSRFVPYLNDRSVRDVTCHAS
jgi:hypothetical protein